MDSFHTLRSNKLSRDQKFFDMYSLVIGVSAAILLAFLVLAMKMSDLTQGVYTRDVAEYQAAVRSRIRPVGQVYRSGEEHESSAPTVETPAEPAPVATAMSGPQVYNTACLACHGAGIGGAPILGDAAQWAERITQGADTLQEHAIQGYTGSTGYMPPKGGRIDLSDAEIAAAVDYMIGEAQ
jgi:cytochrome c5